jgi:hypothetical protein
MPPRPANKADRIFVRDGRRHYRRRYSTTETRIGVAVLLVLAAILGWIIWRGAHPDPALFALETDLSQGGSAGAATTAAAGDRGPVPDGLATDGWSEGAVSSFDSDNLYEKIDGREGYYKGFGFQMLYFVSITRDDDPAVAVDIELYDLGTAANAVGAYSGERPPSVTPDVGETGLSHLDRNALMMTQGHFYLRALGSEESPRVRAELEHLRARFSADLPGEPLPWGFALLVGRLGIPAGSVSYTLENAFSFGFAHNVYSAILADGDTEVYVTPATDTDAATALAARYRDGFLQYGSPAETAGGVQWVKDRYLGSFAGAKAVGPWVVGVRGASDTDTATREIERLAEATADFPLPEPLPELDTSGIPDEYDDPAADPAGEDGYDE